ncbi:hypothetical protein LIER_32279 [Lithospermum erythrorhizon]|uniref:Serine protease n=1 Tax=Lithospermum erythrorhizon TaxID=34254 RepID=A0AAV3RZB4_LITER
MESISPSDLIKLSKELKPCVWVLMAYKDNELFGDFTGFGVKSDGLIMYCAHKINQDRLPDLIDGIEDAKVVKVWKWTGDTVFQGMIYVFSTLIKTPAYRVIGHYLNRSLIEKSRKKDTPLPIMFKDVDIHPLVPVIQSKGFGRGSSASGAPLFNAQGEVIGMHISFTIGYEISVHVSLLKECLRIALRDNPRGKSQHSKVVGEHYSIKGNIFEMGIDLTKCTRFELF